MSLSEVASLARTIARSRNERRLFIIIGENVYDVLNEIENFLDSDSIVVSEDPTIISSFEKISVSPRDAEKLEKKPISNALIDLREYPHLSPMSKIIYNVGGGGLIFVLLPISYLTKEKYINKLTTLGVRDDPRDILRRRFIIKGLKFDGIYIYSTTSKKFVKPIKEVNIAVEKKVKKRHRGFLPRIFYEECKTEDQKVALEKIYEFLDNKSDVLFVVGNRNRGKSEVVGLSLVAFSLDFEKKMNRPLDVVITSQDPIEAQAIIRQVIRILEAMEINFRREQNGILSKIIRVKYADPTIAGPISSDVLIIDEVGGFITQLIKRLIYGKRKIIMILTLHGYGGSSRSLIDRLELILSNLNKTSEHVELKEPLFYREGDPVEKWLEDTLLFDIEPPELMEREVSEIVKNMDKIEFETINFYLHFLGEKESELKAVMGILSSAHYRTSPERILFLADAPHYFALIIKYNGKPIAGLEIVEEGNLTDEEIKVLMKTSPPGNIIPDKMLKYAGAVEFPKMKGWRVYSIAVHPKLIGKHVGSHIMGRIVELAKRKGISWIGASFPGYLDLTLFWTFNKFIPVHISPKINKRIGEHTIIAIRPLNKESEECVKKANIELKYRLLKESNSTFRKLDTRSFRILLKRSFKILDYKLNLMRGQSFRLKLYLGGTLHFESASDVIYDLVCYYFMRGLNALDESEEILLIDGVLKRNRLDIRKIIKIRDIMLRWVVSSINL